MIVSPEAWGRAVRNKAEKMNLDEWQELEAELHPQAPWTPTRIERSYPGEEPTKRAKAAE